MFILYNVYLLRYISRMNHILSILMSTHVYKLLENINTILIMIYRCVLVQHCNIDVGQ